jgi:hypothetical protein
VAVAHGESAASAADLEAACYDVVRATSAEATEAWHGAVAWRSCTAAWRLWRPWRSGWGTAFVAEAYVAAVLEFVYIFQAFVVGGCLMLVVRGLLGLCRR